jgi:hypothetical protein
MVVSFWGTAQLPGLHISKTTDRITIDAEMNEPVWKTAEVATKFKQYFPFDSSYAKAQTEVRMTYDDNFIYVFAQMYNLGKGQYVTPSLRRDFRGEANDSFVVQFDTFQDNTNSFQFGINPFGVQREGLVANGGSTNQSDLSLNWDNKWYSEAKMLEDRWVCEFAIPFKSLRYKHGLSSWNINFYRINSQFAERSTWAPIPRNFPLISLAFTRKLLWDQPLDKPGSNISIIPYAAARSSQNFEKGELGQSASAFGGDAKVAIGPALNLDLTVNPDFSQVEVDQQVTNLDRFEIFFPERRQFFLENADLFSDFGGEGMRPFFSRRIGVTRDQNTGQNIENPIYFGARLSGKVNNNLRIGLLSMQAGEDKANKLPSTNYTVATFQRKVFARSNIGMIFINKQAFQDSVGGDFLVSPQKFNRVIGLDYNLASRDNRWNGKFYYHRSISDVQKDSAFAMSARLAYNTLRWDISGTAMNIGANYNPEVGFARRKDYLRLAPTIWYNFYPKSKIVNSHGPGFDFDVIGNKKYGITDYDYNFMYRIRFQNTAQFNIRLRQEYVYLFSSFDPTNTGSEKLLQGSDYVNNVIVANFTSDARKRLFFDASTRSGEYFNGHRINLTGTLNYRAQPYAVFSLNFSYNKINLPAPYRSADLILIGPRFDFTFSRSLFWTTFVQYNNQINNVNINSRLQWRFRPVSDLFISYTDNYFATDEVRENIQYNSWQPKLRAIVVKFTYWLNL